MINETITNRVKLAMLCMQRASWEQGVAAQALLELGEIDLAILMAREAITRQRTDGRLAELGSDHAVCDPAANGGPVLYAARWTGEEKLRAAADKMLNYLLNTDQKAADGTLYHVNDRPQIWVDALYMAPPFLAVAGHPEEAIRQIEGQRKRLWDPEKKLFYHIWDEGQNDYARKKFWGVGNGWAAAGMTRVIRALPKEMEDEKSRLAGYVKDVIDGCLRYQQPSGLFNNILDDPDSFIEVNLAQMLAYAIYRGVAGGWLAEDYLSKADRLRMAAHARVDEEGLVHDVCGSPDFDHPGTATEGQAFFLLMEAAHHDMG